MNLRTLALALLLGTFAAGCVTSGAPIRAEQVRAITPGKMTKNELLDLFGVPIAIAAPDEVLTLSTLAVMKQPYSSRFNYRQRSDTFFALFPPTDEYGRVYYYHYAVSYNYPVWYLLYFGENGKTDIDRLWVLVNERTGLVEDFAFKQYGEDVIFGRSR